MATHIKLGKLFGIPIGMNISLLVISMLLVLSLSGQLNSMGASSAVALSLAMVAAVMFYGGLVAHELGHALCARRYGVETKEITLWLLGGVAKLSKDAPSAGAEALIAVAGPLTSLLVACFWGLTAVGVGLAVGVDGPLVAVLVWLAFINVILAVFNMIPAFPMDGGRVLRACIWGFKHDKIEGTRAASKVGQVLGWGFIAFGVYMVVGAGDLVDGVWGCFLGMFVLQAGKQETRYVEVQDRLLGRTVQSIAKALPVVLPAELPVNTMMGNWPLRSDYPSYLVGTGGVASSSITGILTWETFQHDGSNRLLKDIAYPWDLVPAVSGTATLVEAVEVLQKAAVGRAKVLGPQGEVVGLLSAQDLLNAIDK